MFLPLASTMSVFNCRAVGVDAEKTFTRSRQVRGWTEGDLGTGKQLGCTQQHSSQSSCPKASPFRSYRITLTCLAVFFTSLKRQAQNGNPKALFLREVWSADGEAHRVPIPACEERWDDPLRSLLFLSCLTQALLRLGMTAPDLVQLQRSSGRQPSLLSSYHFALLLLLCFSSSMMQLVSFRL